MRDTTRSYRSRGRNRAGRRGERAAAFAHDALEGGETYRAVTEVGAVPEPVVGSSAREPALMCVRFGRDRGRRFPGKGVEEGGSRRRCLLATLVGRVLVRRVLEHGRRRDQPEVPGAAISCYGHDASLPESLMVILAGRCDSNVEGAAASDGW